MSSGIRSWRLVHKICFRRHCSYHLEGEATWRGRNTVTLRSGTGWDMVEGLIERMSAAEVLYGSPFMTKVKHPILVSVTHLLHAIRTSPLTPRPEKNPTAVRQIRWSWRGLLYFRKNLEKFLSVHFVIRKHGFNFSVKYSVQIALIFRQNVLAYPQVTDWGRNTPLHIENNC